MKAIVTATQKELRSINIPFDGLCETDLQTGSEVTILHEIEEKHPEHGQMAEVNYLYETVNFLIPVKWLKIL